MAVISKRGFIVAVVLVIVLVFVLLINPWHLEGASAQAESDKNINGTAEKMSIGVAQSHASQVQSSSQTQNSAASSENSQLSEVGAEAEHEVLNKWRRSRGYVNLDQKDGYETYSIETLEKLADAGDFIAGERLIKYYLRDMDFKTGEASGKKAIALKEHLAIYGSTHALQGLGVSAAAAAGHQPPEVKRQKVIESMAYFKVQAMRGDPNGYYDEMTENPLSNSLAKYPLTESDYAEVSVVAQKIYDDLQQKRIALGLGPFDNSVPLEVQNYFKDNDPRVWNNAKAKY